MSRVEAVARRRDVDGLPFTATACGSSAPGLPTDTSPAAVHDLLTGTERPDFLNAISTYDWDDGGAQAGKLFEWIGTGATSADPAVATRAGESASAITHSSRTQRPVAQASVGPIRHQRQDHWGAEPGLTRAFASTVTPFLAAIVCDDRGTMGFTPLDPDCENPSKPRSRCSPCSTPITKRDRR